MPVIPEVQAYREAEAAYEAALKAITIKAADYVDAHPELDTTGEWARMRDIFGDSHLSHWFVSADYEDQIRFHKTTQRGLYDHEIIVRLDDLVQED